MPSTVARPIRNSSPNASSPPFDLLRHEILTTFAPVPDHALEEIVDTVFLPLVH
ncbi:hypothetical protein [Streptomyces sioyaensis]|uniref:hypothetical protein n=1 Tax=Streptomyces sioyaensis TaxID=67364 RepID=UPI003F541015